MSSPFSKLASESRILILDGAMGTMIQRRDLPAGEFINNEFLNLTHPDLIRSIHAAYVAAGADIITTNSFGANRLSQRAYGLADRAPEMALQAARLAREVADRAGRPVLVAGSVGPGGKSLSLATDADDPDYREYDFAAMKACYGEQIQALAAGGADLILLETWYDALNAKAAVKAMEEAGCTLPLVISATVSDRSGRTLTGQTLEAFFRAVRHAPGLSAFGINCALGAAQMTGLVEEISAFSDLPLIFYPNAGIPDEMGAYNDSPALMGPVIASLAQKGQLNIVGGCCGTTPEHIRAMAEAVRGAAPRHPQPRERRLVVSGLEAVPIDPARNFTNIGERTNVAGSRKFARLISEGKYGEALQVAADQIEGGASVIDINMDDAMLDAPVEMRRFLRHISSDPAVARAAIMIDSSRWEVIETALENVQGKSIVNSISLKDGEETFLRKARHIRDMGAAMVVMAFDEEGQATTYERKIAICERSYRLLTGAGIAPEDIIFDGNILSVGTGIPEHARFAVDFIEAVRWIKQHLDGALTSGGVSNLSFAFRGQNAVREAMHSAFLYHAIQAGLDMAIVNPQMLQVYDSIEPSLLRCVEDVIFDRDPEATQRLVAKAAELQSAAAETPADAPGEIPRGTAEERICAALVQGNAARLEADLMESLAALGTPVQVIEGPLMRGMETVGDLFAQGKMFLPQVVKSAKVMRDAVSLLEPYMEDSGSVSDRPKIIMATVKGDVHDIGKNITSIVLQCSGFEVIDLGVMVPCEEILARAEETGAVIIGVSGLITPSLYRMEELCREMTARGLQIPLFVGGAAASALHTAVKLCPLYANVHYGPDASAMAVMAKKCMTDPEGFQAEESARYAALREYRTQAQAPAGAVPSRPAPYSVFVPGMPFGDIPLEKLSVDTVLPFFDWRLFAAVCGIKGRQESLPFEAEARTLLAAPDLDIQVCARFYACWREGDDIVSGDGILRLPMLRQEQAPCRSLADFFPETADCACHRGAGSPLGLFAIKVEGGSGDNALLLHAVRVTLAEAASAWLQDRFSKEAPAGAKVILPGIGYACCPDHSLKRDVLERLPIGIRLTDSCAMIPEASVCGLVIAHPEAFFPDITRLSEKARGEYLSRRPMSAEEASVFLGSLSSDAR